MFETIKEKNSVSITLDRFLIEKLRNYKVKKGIKDLSPMINEILWNWMYENEEK